MVVKILRFLIFLFHLFGKALIISERSELLEIEVILFSFIPC